MRTRMNHPLVPPLGTRVLVEAIVVHHNVFARDEGPTLPVPVVKVREGISFGVACEYLQPAWPAPSEAKR